MDVFKLGRSMFDRKVAFAIMYKELEEIKKGVVSQRFNYKQIDDPTSVYRNSPGPKEQLGIVTQIKVKTPPIYTIKFNDKNKLMGITRYTFDDEGLETTKLIVETDGSIIKNVCRYDNGKFLGSDVVELNIESMDLDLDKEITEADLVLNLTD